MSQPVDKPAPCSQNDPDSIMALTSTPSQYPARSPSRAGESAERSTSRAGEHRRERAPSRSAPEYGRERAESRAGGDYQRPSSRTAGSRASSRAAESRAPSRAAESRAPSRAAESRAPSRAAESRAPSQAGGYDDDDDIGPSPSATTPTTTTTATTPTARSTSDLFTGVYRNLKKFGQSREELAPRPPQLRLQLSHTQLQSQSQSPFVGHSRARGGGGDRHWPQSATATTAPYSFPIQAKNSRSLSLQDSLAKPLPDTPPNPSPEALLTPLAERADILTRLVEDDDESEDDSFMDSTNPAAMHGDADGGMGQGGTRQQQGEEAGPKGASSQPNAAGLSPRTQQQQSQQSGPGGAGGGGGTAATAAPVQGPSASLSGLVCNVHRTTGREPRPLVGASTTIMGDTLYVFGGRVLSRSKSASITSELYELDLIRRHWTKVEMTGDIPPPRYFHSMCPLGDTKMVCYGGMSPAFGQLPPYQPDQYQQHQHQQQQQPEVSVMTDIHIYDIPTKRWVLVPTQDPPEGRYAHCACVLPSSAVFTSHRAPLSALHHNPSSSGNPNEGRIGVNIDGAGGAEMIVVGGQDAANHYIEQISVFNLRSLRWTSTQPLGKSCGAYRSVVAPLPPAVSARIGRGHPSGPLRNEGISAEAREPGSSLLIYSNYNFLDVKLELQIRSPDGILSEKLMSGDQSPPGLRFPNGGVIDTHFVVSGTYLTSSKQEYALWALDLKSLTWSRIDAGGNVFSQGSWNRGVLWSRRNGFVILGSRRRSLVDDYNHRRINFTNICLVELEAFGFYDNPRRTSAMSGYISASSPYHGGLGLSVARKAGSTAGGRFHSRASEELGEKILAMRELADMDILCIGGERIPVSSRIVARRWGPYFVQLLREGTATQDGSDAVTLRSGMSPGMRTTIVPSSRQADAIASSAAAGGGAGPAAGPATSAGNGALDPSTINSAPTPKSLPPGSRPRILYLPHTYLTIQALLHYLYCSALPAPSSPLCTPQILCSLLQIARPYRIDGLLEAVIERLHALLDSRNAAAVFNATAMAAGGGRGIDGSLNPNFFVPASDHVGAESFLSEDGNGTRAGSKNHDRYGGGGDAIEAAAKTAADGGIVSLANRATGLTINTTVPGYAGGRPPSDELSASGASVSGSEWSASEMSESDHGKTGGAGPVQREIWNGELSSVVGLQKRGLRGLMEGRRLRERTGTNTGLAGYQGAASTTTKVGLGIAGT